MFDVDEHKIYHNRCKEQDKVEGRALLFDEANKTFLLVFPFDPYLITLIKQIGGATWDGTFWKVINPTSVSAKQLLDLAELCDFEYDTKVLFYLESLITEGAQTMLESMASQSSFEIQGLAKKPYPFQAAGIEFAIEHKRVIIGDQMGLGKTIQAIGMVTHMQLYPAIVVCPAIVKLNWQREILAWVLQNDRKKIHIISGRSTYDLPDANWYVINYDILPSWVKPLRSISPQIIILDEIHYAKSASSLRGRAARELAKGIHFVLGLSGTPILNRPVELVNPLRILDRIDELGGRTYYERRYCEAGKDNFGRWNTSGAANLKELNDRLRSTGILIRRLKKDVLTDLPRKLPPAIIPIELTNIKEYRKAERDLARWLGERAVEDDDFKQSIEHLKPIDKVKAISIRRGRVEWQARRTEQQKRLMALKRLSTEGKFEGIKEHVNNFLMSGEKLVLFGWFVDTQRDLVVEWPHAAHALGVDSNTQRQKAIDNFQQTDVQLLICSLTAIGIGVNLTAAHHVGFAELGWTPAEHDQAEDRLHRIGQKFPVNVYYYVGVGTIEEDIVDIIDRKRRIIGPAVDGIPVTHEDVQNALIGKLIAKYKDDRRVRV